MTGRLRLKMEPRSPVVMMEELLRVLQVMRPDAVVTVLVEVETAEVVKAGVASELDLAVSRECEGPGCEERIAWSGRGRRKRFCSDACRKRAEREKKS